MFVLRKCKNQINVKTLKSVFAVQKSILRQGQLVSPLSLLNENQGIARKQYYRSYRHELTNQRNWIVNLKNHQCRNYVTLAPYYFKSHFHLFHTSSTAMLKEHLMDYAIKSSLNNISPFYTLVVPVVFFIQMTHL